MSKKRKRSYKRRYIEEKKKTRELEERLKKTEKILSDMTWIAILELLMIETGVKFDKQKAGEEHADVCEKGEQR